MDDDADLTLDRDLWFVLHLRYGDPARLRSPREVAAALGTEERRVIELERLALHALRSAALKKAGQARRS
jgi:hypothetical protein